jgi:hypothetical protein
MLDASPETPAGRRSPWPVSSSPWPVSTRAFDTPDRPIATAFERWNDGVPRPVSGGIAHDLIRRSDEMRLAHADVRQRCAAHSSSWIFEMERYVRDPRCPFGARAIFPSRTVLIIACDGPSLAASTPPELAGWRSAAPAGQPRAAPARDGGGLAAPEEPLRERGAVLRARAEIDAAYSASSISAPPSATSDRRSVSIDAPR